MSEYDEQLAKLRADVDQALEAVKAMARGTRAFYSELTEQGFAHDDAMTLTGIWLQGMAPR